PIFTSVNFWSVTSHDTSNSITPANLGPGASNVPAGSNIADDTDSSITYNGPGWQSEAGASFQGSARYTNNSGDSCSFNFVGTQVFYFAGGFNPSASIDISIDGGSSAKLSDPSSGNPKLTQRLVWSSPILKDGQHTITVTHSGNSGDFVGVDFFMYHSGLGGSGGYNGSKSVPTAAIVGAGVGGGVLLTLIILVALIIRRRRQTSKSKPNRPDVRYTATPVYEPYSGKESTLSPRPQSTLSYGNSGLDSPGIQGTAGGISVH
ncbi:hypothetical protein FRC12_020630, partial [Ceratobasidium sp. 428]